MTIPAPTRENSGMTDAQIADWHAKMAILDADSRTAGNLPRPARLVARVLEEAGFKSSEK